MDAKTNGAMPAAPCQPVDRCGNPCMEMPLGLTKREAFAMAAMQGLLANPGGPVQRSEQSGWHLCNCVPEDAAGFAVDMADALLSVLSRAALSQEPQ